MSPNQTLLDVHEIHEVAAPVSTSSLGSSSIDTGSPTLLTPESLPHDVRSSLGSSNGIPTVKFAPLPHIDPSRRRSLVPLGVSGRSRRKQVMRQEGGSLLWSTDPDVPEENMEDPIIAFAKFVKKTGKTLWGRVRKCSKAVSQENASHSAEPILDIRSTVFPGDMALGEKGQHVLDVVGGEDKRGRRASWSPLAERRTLSWEEVKRRSTSDLPSLSVVP